MRERWGFAFGGSGLDRAAALRGDAQAQSALYPAGRILPLWRGKPLARDKGALVWLPADHPVLCDAGDIVFLGQEAGQGFFAADLAHWAPPAAPVLDPPLFLDPNEERHPLLPENHAFVELRGLMLALSAREAELAAMARAVLGWHRSHAFCAACGARSELHEAGWQRQCPACGTRHFPRTDPVVIMLVTRGNQTLVGRSPGWPEGMYSCLAGFVEPGETIEAAVRREVAEETGIPVGQVRYLASQPWPFPASLMIGCMAEALAEDIQLDPVELEDARWISREDMVDVMAGRHPEVKAPRRGAIAHALLENWLADRCD
jgi:NAD+ diphosphatase